ncbi:hypothetical protein [Verrucomicrobium sp. BvORR106]|uniref:hypothetical protein n=1 Tax=Verrucomicrobium sp. BvORR106 TaxID=1403819 RepID=UPI002240EC27|nr:hypothetical protein [Verrucomicrobium sp. BvORR106]
MQMGANTAGLVSEEGLDGYSGVILSPVNQSQADLRDHVSKFYDKGVADIRLDPQLYSPKAAYRHLPTHDYFPSDIESQEISTTSWWKKLGKQVANYAAMEIGCTSVCSPAILPKKWTDDYYLRCFEGYESLTDSLSTTKLKSILTVCVGYEQLSTADDALRIGSLVAQTKAENCYLVIVSDVEPRREFSSVESLSAILALIYLLEKMSCKVTVSHCGSDMMLFKSAQATNCATGKWWNLRRFAKSRFEESDDEGRQIAYWFEHKLAASIRTADILLLQRDSPKSFGSDLSVNSFGNAILSQFQSEPANPWIGLGWRQYLRWFYDTESTLNSPESLEIVRGWLKDAEQEWEHMEDKDVILEESRNDGRWIRAWRKALSEFTKITKGW